MKKTIEGPLESINEQLSDLRKKNTVKIVSTKTGDIKVANGKKRNWLTVVLELTEK